jgi:6-phosphogluconolactonase (cycloisomerase 2 family)
VHPSILQGATQQFAATASFSDGTVQNVTTTASWNSSDSAIATISNTAGSQGLATAVSVGAVTISATLREGIGSTGLLVNPATQTLFPRFAFIAGGDGTVTSTSVNPSTGLLRNNGFVFEGAPSGGAIAVDPGGKFVFIGNGLNNNTISVFSISGSGSLSEVSGSPFATGANPAAVAVHPSGNFLYVANRDVASISAYTIDPITGALTATPGSPFFGGGVGNPTENPSALAIDPAGKFLLVAETGIAKVAVYTINQTTGDLTELANSPFDSGGVPISIAIESHGKFAFVANDGDNTVSAYSIDAVAGTLTALAGSPFLTGGTPEAVATDAAGKFVYVANTGDATISAYAIDSVSGNLTDVSGSPFASSFRPSSITADPSGRFLYVVNGDASISVFGIDPNTGALAILGVLPSRAGIALAITSGTTPVAYTPQFAYVANAGSPSGSNNISGYSINPSTGVLSSVTGSPFAESFSPTSLLADPLAPYLYVTNKCSDLSCTAANGSISAYVINSTAGSLTNILASPFVAGAGPIAATVDPSGRFAYAVNSTDNTLSAYTINPATGSLTPMAGSPFSTGLGPQSVVIDSTGAFLYVLNSCSDISCLTGSLSAYTIATDTGVPTFVGSTGVGKIPKSVTIEPTARFIYVVNQGDGTVSAFAIDRLAGLPGPLSGSPFAAGLNLSSIAADPLGRFAFATATSANEVAAYTIDPNSGFLTSVSGTPFSTGTGPASLAVDISGKFLYVVNGNSNSISAFSIDPATGALTSVATSPFAAGTVPNSITTTGKVQ